MKTIMRLWMALRRLMTRESKPVSAELTFNKANELLIQYGAPPIDREHRRIWRLWMGGILSELPASNQTLQELRNRSADEWSMPIQVIQPLSAEQLTTFLTTHQRFMKLKAFL